MDDDNVCKNGPTCRFYRMGRCKFYHETQLTCYLCKKAGHTTLTCPEAICQKCGKKGHITRKCPFDRSSMRLYTHEPGPMRLYD